MPDEHKRGPKPKEKVLLPVGVPDPPSGLSAAAKKHWRRLTTEMASAKVISLLDLDPLTVYVDLWEQREEARRQLARKPKPGEDPGMFGPVVRGPNGCPMQNPWFKISATVTREMRQYMMMFGLSPAARSRLIMPEPDEEEDPKWKDLD